MFPQICGYVKGTVELSWNAFSTSTSPSPHSFLLLTFSFSYYPELGQTLQGKDTVLYPYIRYQPQTQVSPSYSHFCQAAINFGVPTTLSGLRGCQRTRHPCPPRGHLIASHPSPRLSVERQGQRGGPSGVDLGHRALALGRSWCPQPFTPPG